MTPENGSGKTEGPEIKPGRFVRIKPSRMDEFRNFTPKDLFEIGWPNKFLVWGVFEDRDGKTCLKLDPCCDHMVNRATGQHRCNGHHADIFELVEFDPEDLEEVRGESHVSVDLFGWRAFAADYHEGEKTIVLKTPVSRAPVVLTGEIFKGLAEQAKALGWI